MSWGGAASPAILSLLVAALAYATMQMMIVPALPAIEADLGADAGDVAWLISAYLTATAIASPLAGRCGDLFGKRRVLIIVLAIFSVGGVVGASASSVEVLVLARALQGVGGAIFPLAYGLLPDILPAPRVPIAIGLVSGSFGVGGSAGLVLSGPLVDHVAWQATVGLGAALGVVAIVCVLRFVPTVQRVPRVPLDIPGGALLVIGMVLLLLGIAAHGGVLQWSRLAPLVGGAVALAAWAAWELRQRMPLVDVRVLAQRSVWPVNVVGAFIGFGMYATGFLVPQLVQADPETGVGFGAGVTETSLFLLPALVIGFAAGATSGVLGRRHGSLLPFLLGTATMGAGYLVLIVGVDSPVAVILGALLAHGIGLNLAMAAMANLIIEAAPRDRASEAVGVNATVRTVGGAFGIQIVALVMLAPSGAKAIPTVAGFDWGFALCAALMITGIGLMTAMGRRRKPTLNTAWRKVDTAADK